MTKFSLLMPALGLLYAASLLINSFGGEKKKLMTGVIVRSADTEMQVQAGDTRTTFQLTPETRIHLNERALSPQQIEKGRKATVAFTSVKKKLVAQSVDLFPVPDDFKQT